MPSSKEELLGKVVKAPDVNYLGILFPRFHITNKADQFTKHPLIYTSTVNMRVRSMLDARRGPWVGFSLSGGDITLTREDLFQLCSRRQRKFPDKGVLNDCSEREFLNMCAVLAVVDKPIWEDDTSSIYPIFVALASFSKDALKLAFEYMAGHSPYMLLSSLVTFYGRVAKSDKDNSGSSAHYQMTIQRASKKRPQFVAALLTLPKISNLRPELQVQHLILAVVA